MSDDLKEFGFDKDKREEDAPVVPMDNPSALTFDAGTLTPEMKGLLDRLTAAVGNFSDMQDKMYQAMKEHADKLNAVVGKTSSYLTDEEIDEFARRR